MQILWTVLGIAVGVVCLVLSLLILIRREATQTVLELGNLKVTTDKLGVVILVFAFVAFGAPFLYHQGVSEGAENSIPSAPSEQDLPTTTVTAVATVTVTAPPANEPMSSPPRTQSTSYRTSDPSPTQVPKVPTPVPKGPWRAEKNGIRLIVERCSHEMSKYELFGCQIRLENGSRDYIYLNGDEPIIFVDDHNGSYGLDDRDTTFPTNEWASIDSQDTKRGIVVLEANPPSRTKRVQIRLALSRGGSNFVLSANIPYSK